MPPMRNSAIVTGAERWLALEDSASAEAIRKVSLLLSRRLELVCQLKLAFVC